MQEGEGVMRKISTTAVILILLAAIFIAGCETYDNVEYNTIVLRLERKLQSRNPDKRAEAANQLAELWPDAVESIPALIKATGDPHPDVRRASILALNKLKADLDEFLPILMD